MQYGMSCYSNVILSMLIFLPNRSWIYALILTIDANFRLKLKEKGILNDPALGDGWAHWVQDPPYRAYIKKYGHQVEVCLVYSCQ